MYVKNGLAGKGKTMKILLCRKDIDRFMRRIRIDGINKETGCYVPVGKTRRGYKKFSINSKPYQAHRVAWVIANGPIPSNLHVLHKCNNRACVNPEHLYLGTEQDNTNDRLRKKGVNMYDDEKRLVGIKVSKPFFTAIKVAIATKDLTLHDAVVRALGAYFAIPEELQADELSKGVKEDEGLPIRESVGSNEAKSL
jgi:hypothetical protein